MSYQFSNVETAGRTKYFPLEITRVSRNEAGGVEVDQEFSRFVFLTNYSESFEATWTEQEGNFGILNKTYRYSQTNRKLALSFKLPARNVADSKENLEFCQKLSRLVYGKYYRQPNSENTFGMPSYNYQGALFDIRFNFGNLIRNENVYVDEFQFSTNFDAGIFEYSATPVATENGERPLGALKDSLFAQDSADLPETSYTSHAQQGKIYPKEVQVDLQLTILHDYELGFGGPRREGEPLKWAENRNRDWPHGTGPTYPVLEYMSEDEINIPEPILSEEQVEQVEIIQRETPEDPLSGTPGGQAYYINEYGEVVLGNPGPDSGIIY